jgi:probable DNA metabolism protein
LIVPHFRSRYAGQPWIIYDTNRNCGLYYDTRTVAEVTFPQEEFSRLKSGIVDEDRLSDDEAFFQQLWKAYFKSITIKERINLKLQRQQMPRRYWKYLTEMQ